MYKLLLGRRELKYDGELKANKIFSFAGSFTYDCNLRNVVLLDNDNDRAYLIIRKNDKHYKCVKIDLEDARLIATFNWIHSSVCGVDYIKTKRGKSYTWLARVLTNKTEGAIYHKNSNSLDYRKANLITEKVKDNSMIDNITINPFNENNKSGLSYIHFQKRKDSVVVTFKYKRGEVYMTESSKDFEDGVRGALRAIVKRKYNFTKEHFDLCLWTIEECEGIIKRFPITQTL